NHFNRRGRNRYFRRRSRRPPGIGSPLFRHRRKRINSPTASSFSSLTRGVVETGSKAEENKNHDSVRCEKSTTRQKRLGANFRPSKRSHPFPGEIFREDPSSLVSLCPVSSCGQTGSRSGRRFGLRPFRIFGSAIDGRLYTNHENFGMGEESK